MKKVQIGGGFISPALLAHVQKNSTPGKTAQPCVYATDAQVGGGIISPHVKKHVAASAKIAFGGGLIHPQVAKHVQTQ